MTNSLLKAIKNILPFRKPTLFNFNIVGLDDNVKMDQQFLKDAEELKVRIHDFNKIAGAEIDRTYDEFDNKKRIQRKMAIANQIIAKVNELYESGKRNSLYKADYKMLKQELILTLVRLFGSSADAEVLEDTVRALEINEIVPPGSRTALAKLSPIGRWL